MTNTGKIGFLYTFHFYQNKHRSVEQFIYLVKPRLCANWTKISVLLKGVFFTSDYVCVCVTKCLSWVVGRRVQYTPWRLLSEISVLAHHKYEFEPRRQNRQPHGQSVTDAAALLKDWRTRCPVRNSSRVTPLFSLGHPVIKTHLTC